MVFPAALTIDRLGGGCFTCTIKWHVTTESPPMSFASLSVFPLSSTRPFKIIFTACGPAGKGLSNVGEAAGHAANALSFTAKILSVKGTSMGPA